MAPFERLADESFCYLTTTGRRTGRPHTVEMWFALEAGAVYLLSGGRDSADWVKNLRRDPAVGLRINTQRSSGVARVLEPGTHEDALARRLLDAKYMRWREGKPLSSWARGSLAVAIDLPLARLS